MRHRFCIWDAGVMISLCNKLSDLPNESQKEERKKKWEMERQGWWRNGNQAFENWKKRCAVELFVLPKSSPLHTLQAWNEPKKKKKIYHLCPVTDVTEWHRLCLCRSRCLIIQNRTKIPRMSVQPFLNKSPLLHITLLSASMWLSVPLCLSCSY